jgi:hypothetical protein
VVVVVLAVFDVVVLVVVVIFVGSVEGEAPERHVGKRRQCPKLISYPNPSTRQSWTV